MQKDTTVAETPALSVIVPVCNGANTLADCLQALVRETRLVAAEILVVDDGSRDDSSAIATAFDVSVLRFDSSRGPGAARNLGARAASGAILVFVDADVTVADGTFARICEGFRQHPDYTALIGSYDHDPVGSSLVSRYRNLLHHYVHQHTSKTASHFWTGLGAIRAAVFSAVGGFDEGRYGRACEDVELGYRLREQGYRIHLDRSLQGKHLKRWTLGSMMDTDLRLRAIPWTHLLLERAQLPDDFSLGWSQRRSVVLAWLFVLFGIAALVRPAMVSLALLALLGFALNNYPFLRLLQRQCGWRAWLACLPLHLLYHFYSGAGFVIGLLTFYWGKLRTLVFPVSERV